MKIYGLQKMTLLDYPGKVACTVFLGGCDFRCPFCHNFELVDISVPPVMEQEELLAFLRKRVGLLEGVAITGGEPCLNPGLPELLWQIKSLGYPVKLDTNGNHPDMLERILNEGLVDYVAMDIKNSPGKYALTIGLDEFDLTGVRRSIELLKDAAEYGALDYEFRTTVIDEFHDEADMEEIGAMISGARRHYLQAFTDRDTVPYEGFHAPSREKMAAFRDILSGYVDQEEIRGVDL